MFALRRLRKPTHGTVVAYLALFVALGGTAYAANTIGSADIIDESILSADIKDGEVKGSELKKNAVNSAKLEDGSVATIDLAPDAVDGAHVLDGSLTGADVSDGTLGSSDIMDDTFPGGGLGASDIATNAIGQPEIATDGVGATEIADDSIDAGEIVDFGLSNQDVGVLFAQINLDGTVANSSGGVTTVKIGAGVYEVDFGRTISSCAFVATQGEAGAGGAGGAIMGVTDRAGNSEAVFVTTRTNANALSDHAFQLVVVC
jgi:hypothetical protein